MLPSNSLARAVPTMRLLLAQSRNMSSVVASPPRVRISFPEKVAHGIAIAVGCLTVPVWVLLNIKHYKKRN